MIKLTDRLQLLADEVNIGESMADIGTDHGFLPISLWERGVSPKVIMADVSAGSLKKAEDNGRMLYPDQEFDLRLGDGLKVLENGEVDDIVIAGMGGLLMIKIFEADMEKTMSFKKFILQPRISSGKLRHWLLHNGMSIVTDTLVREGRFICNIISAVTDENVNIPEIQADIDEILSYDEEDIRLDVPVWIKNHELFREYAERRLMQEEDILKQMENSGSQWNNKKEKTFAGAEYLRGLLL